MPGSRKSSGEMLLVALMPLHPTTSNKPAAAIAIRADVEEHTVRKGRRTGKAGAGDGIAEPIRMRAIMVDAEQNIFHAGLRRAER